MELKKFLCVNASDIILIDYMFVDQDLYGYEHTYPKPHSVAIGGNNSIKLFEKNGIPSEYQKMFMTCNKISMIINEFKNPNESNLPISRFNKIKAHEYLTDIPIDLTVNKHGNVFGQMGGEKPAFDVNHCYMCEKEDVLHFLVNLRENKLLDGYLKTLEEITHLNIKSYFDSNQDKIKKYSKIKNS